jgi:hypothetical protein
MVLYSRGTVCKTQLSHRNGANYIKLYRYVRSGERTGEVWHIGSPIRLPGSSLNNHMARFARRFVARLAIKRRFLL